MSRFRNPNLRRLEHVFAGAAGGVFDLPQRVRAAVDAVDRLVAEQVRVRALPESLADLVLVEEITAAAKAGKGRFPTADKLVVADQERRARAAYDAALAQSLDELENQVENAVVGCADEIVSEHLRPALAEVMVEVSEIAELLAPYGLDHAALLEAPEPARKARRQLDAVAARYTALRNAQSALGSLREQPQIEAGKLFEIRNRTDLCAGLRAGAPWPDDTVAKLIWFADHHAEVWMPTPAERETAALDEIEAVKAAREEVPA